jgi:hypothetical protein
LCCIILLGGSLRASPILPEDPMETPRQSISHETADLINWGLACLGIGFTVLSPVMERVVDIAWKKCSECLTSGKNAYRPPMPGDIENLHHEWTVAERKEIVESLKGIPEMKAGQMVTNLVLAEIVQTLGNLNVKVSSGEISGISDEQIKISKSLEEIKNIMNRAHPVSSSSSSSSNQWGSSSSSDDGSSGLSSGSGSIQRPNSGGDQTKEKGKVSVKSMDDATESL